MKIERIRPEEIERRSFEIITDLLGEQQPPDETAHIVKRVIHTTADLEYAETLYFSENAAQILSQALAEGAHIVTDTQMALSGINKKTLAAFGGQVHCFMADEDVARQARERGVTRACVSMEKAAVSVYRYPISGLLQPNRQILPNNMMMYNSLFIILLVVDVIKYEIVT